MTGHAPIRQLDGVLFFPVTPYDSTGAVDTGLLRDHIASRLDHRPGAVFAACGTGEFHALSQDEVGAVVRTAVETVGGRTPVFGAAGGPLPHAVACARAAAEAGADGLLVLPPYLVGAPDEGLIRYFETVAEASDLPVVVYSRANAALTPAVMARLARHPKIIGFKDGVGDMSVAQQIVLEVAATGRPDFLFFNGLLTAELTQAAYRGIGIPLYSSAVFAMAPDIADAFYAAYVGGDDTARQRLLREFYRPLVALRDQVPGYAVALIKAGVRQGGLPVGGVRAPLLDPTPAHESRLADLLARARELTAEPVAVG
ncbi:MAG TPA: 5-dehydro-4-deoxyglucarate dehydratase [Microlunatus sp.]|nr:5-dehydro-4-deoxyglucarate dehydratase [Microlunatus sp.]